MGERISRHSNGLAPDFERIDTRGRNVRLSDYRGMNVVLVLNRGFT